MKRCEATSKPAANTTTKPVNLTKWVCEECGELTDLTKTPFKETLVNDLDAALQIDLQAKERGETITRSG